MVGAPNLLRKRRRIGRLSGNKLSKACYCRPRDGICCSGGGDSDNGLAEDDSNHVDLYASSCCPLRFDRPMADEYPFIQMSSCRVLRAAHGFTTRALRIPRTLMAAVRVLPGPQNQFQIQGGNEPQKAVYRGRCRIEFQIGNRILTPGWHGRPHPSG